MISLNGYIKLFRKILSWQWYSKSVIKDVFLHLLLLASFKEKKWCGIIIKEGQVVIGTQKLADDLGFTRQQVRTALKKLEESGEITKDSTNKYTLITIEKWHEYQGYNKDLSDTSTQCLTSKKPSSNHQLTCNKPHRNNIKNNKKEENYKDSFRDYRKKSYDISELDKIDTLDFIE